MRLDRALVSSPWVCILHTYVPTPRRELGLLPAPGLGHTFREVLVGPLAESLKPLVEMTPVLGCTWPAWKSGCQGTERSVLGSPENAALPRGGGSS